MAYILHIDTSTEICTVALSKDGTVVGTVQNTEPRNHASVLNNNIAQLLATAEMTLKDIDVVSVCGGPGSYTGLRIGLATAKGYCYTLDKPLMLHSRLLLLANNYNNAAASTLAIQEAREGEYFIAAYNSDLQPLLEPCHVHEADILEKCSVLPNKILIVGTISPTLVEVFSAFHVTHKPTNEIDVTAWAKHSFAQYKAGIFSSLAHAEPFYLKQVYTHKPKASK